MESVYDLLGLTNTPLGQSILGIVMALVALVIALQIVRVLFRRAERRVVAKGHDVTPLRYLRYGVRAAIYIICLAAALRNVPGMHTVVTGLLAGSGILAVVVGLASQQALGNIVSGAIILLFRPFKIGDTLRYNNADIQGEIADIGLRHTTICTGIGSRILIPNSLMNSNLVEIFPREAVESE